MVERKVLSVEPLSIARISKFVKVWAVRLARVSVMKASPFHTGRITEISGGVGFVMPLC